MPSPARGKTSVHVAGFHYLLWSDARQQGDARVVNIAHKQWAEALSCTVPTMSRLVAKMERQGRIRCLTTGTRGAKAYLFEILDPADFDTEAHA
jgi:CRP-like cAMP-binding protein